MILTNQSAVLLDRFGLCLGFSTSNPLGRFSKRSQRTAQVKGDNEFVFTLAALRLPLLKIASPSNACLRIMGSDGMVFDLLCLILPDAICVKVDF